MDGDIRIIEAKSKKDLAEFILFPWKIYRGQRKYKNWVPPLIIDEKSTLNKEKNPFYKHAESANFIAYKDGKIAGRISAIIDRNYIDFHNDKCGFLGFFESYEDQEVASALFSTAEEWVRERGLNRIMGPMNPSTNHMLGVLIDSFERPPVVQMNYNPPYYVNLYQRAGYHKEKDLYCYMMDNTLPLSDKIRRVAEISRKRNRVEVRSINMKRFDQEVEKIHELYNSTWERNWGFVPWTKEEFEHMAKDLKLIAIPELVTMAFIEGRLVGISIPLPDINEILIRMNGRLLPTGIFKLLFGKNRVSRMRLAIFGVRREYRNKGIDGIFVYETYRKGQNMGFKEADFSWILEDNYPLRNLLEAWGTTHYRTYRIYGKEL
ncbi:MAG: hypothetical protein DRP87_15005 [Spirochaetes bacterium]|nr:MAG: hypothetical protein DRP87_15005 [Spirochaetota bacterium]